MAVERAKTRGTEAVEVDDRSRYLGVESAEGEIRFFSYLSLRHFVIQHGEFDPKKLEQMDLYFDEAIVSIEGRGLMKLTIGIRRETIAVVRIGSDPSGNVEISKIHVRSKRTET